MICDVCESPVDPADTRCPACHAYKCGTCSTYHREPCRAAHVPQCERGGSVNIGILAELKGEEEQ